ncbi:uncharacterized protein TNIN_300221 [Trichonephila inaurata madagascariensis]|uniref:Uncharacterized protein n=1 Tax=Trichonephila inaurata madagascariensis TaxID=2747483 RepID=A0A8X7BUV0_9ARAC|nr:uncharacterized protein TNIN_300221 [Trichonephila inaurata madagascariensis]
MQIRGGKKTNMTETSDISKAQTCENQLNQPIQLTAFDPNNYMQVISWFNYFNDKCQKLNLDDSWKITYITNYLKNSALTDYINYYNKIKNWEEFACFLTEKYLAPSITSLSDFTQKNLNLPTSLILEGLIDDLPINLRQLIAMSPSSNPTEWIVTATKVLKIQNSEQNKIENPSNSRTLIFNASRENYQNWIPRHFRPNKIAPSRIPNQTARIFNSPKIHFQRNYHLTRVDFANARGFKMPIIGFKLVHSDFWQ